MPEICVDQSCPAQKSGEAHSHDPAWYDDDKNKKPCPVVGCSNTLYCRHPSNSKCARAVPEQVDHPSHYGGKDNPYEAIKVLSAWRLGFLLGNCVKYISRAGKKDPSKLVEDLKKARWYLDDAIQRLERGEELF